MQGRRGQVSRVLGEDSLNQRKERKKGHIKKRKFLCSYTFI